LFIRKQWTNYFSIKLLSVSNLLDLLHPLVSLLLFPIVIHYVNALIIIMVDFVISALVLPFVVKLAVPRGIPTECTDYEVASNYIEICRYEAHEIIRVIILGKF